MSEYKELVGEGILKEEKDKDAFLKANKKASLIIDNILSVENLQVRTEIYKLLLLNEAINFDDYIVNNRAFKYIRALCGDICNSFDNICETGKKEIKNAH